MLRHTRDEGERGGIDAVTKACRCRTVVEDVAQMCVAASARNLCPLHPETVVPPFDDVLLCNRPGKAWPARARIEFVMRIEQRRLAADAAKQPVPVQIPISARERGFRVGMAGDLKRGRGKPLAPLVFAEHEFGCKSGTDIRSRAVEIRDFDQCNAAPKPGVSDDWSKDQGGRRHRQHLTAAGNHELFTHVERSRRTTDGFYSPFARRGRNVTFQPASTRPSWGAAGLRFSTLPSAWAKAPADELSS